MTQPKYFFAKENPYGDEDGTGFNNTGRALVFGSERGRNEFVKSNHEKNLSVKAITAKEASTLTKVRDGCFEFLSGEDALSGARVSVKEMDKLIEREETIINSVQMVMDYLSEKFEGDCPSDITKAIALEICPELSADEKNKADYTAQHAVMKAKKPTGGMKLK